jgi:hypothetical protein
LNPLDRFRARADNPFRQRLLPELAMPVERDNMPNAASA